MSAATPGPNERVDQLIAAAKLGPTQAGIDNQVGNICQLEASYESHPNKSGAIGTSIAQEVKEAKEELSRLKRKAPTRHRTLLQ